MPKNSTTGAFSTATSTWGDWTTRASTRVVALTVIPRSPGLGMRTVQPMQTISSEMSDDGRMTSTTLPVIGVTVCAFACVKQLPPAPMPEPVVAPAVRAAAPPPAGVGRLVVDVVDGPAPVQRIEMASQPSPSGRGFRLYETSKLLCPAAPCVADVPVGNVLLGFPVVGNRNATEVELVHVGPDPSVYRRTLSVYTDETGGTRVFGIIAASVGAAAAITGTVLLPVGLSKDNDPLATAGGIMLGAGAALLAIGIWAIRHDAPTFRPGASNHFPMPQ